MSREYVELRDGGYRITGTRVSLDSIVYEFRNGESPEKIRDNFSSLSLEQVYGAITYYLAHQVEIDTYLRQGEDAFAELQERTRQANPALTQKLQEAQRLSRRS
jgi:uncharacterized protein (DUF433 family)